MRPYGLTGTQFTILQVLTMAGEMTQGQLGHVLSMDSTSLTRTLGIMIRQRWLTKRHGTDKREWKIRLSRAGALQFEGALPAWQKTQQFVKDQIGAGPWDQLMKLTDDLTNAITLKEDRHDK